MAQKTALSVMALPGMVHSFVAKVVLKSGEIIPFNSFIEQVRNFNSQIVQTKKFNSFIEQIREFDSER